METNKPRTYQTPPGIAKLLGVAPEKIIAAIRDGELRAVDLASPGARRPRYRVAPAELDAWLQRRAVTPIPRQ